MREIKFRGKREDNGDWVFGDLIRHYENQRRFIACDQLAFTYSECGIDRLVTERFYEVIPETVGQFTGLKDKNGIEIYEGDIVHIAIMGRFEKAISEEDAIVVFENGRFGMHRGFDWHLTSFDSFCDTEFEVIGNIYENPKVLEMEDEKHE